jgi:hypothetical protein
VCKEIHVALYSYILLRHLISIQQAQKVQKHIVVEDPEHDAKMQSLLQVFQRFYSIGSHSN